MKIATPKDINLHYTDQGIGPVMVFVNSLGADFRLWNSLVARLPEGLRIIRYDMRGHGLSSVPKGDYFMGDMVAAAAAFLDHLKVRNCAFVGLSIGGMVAQGLAAARLSLPTLALVGSQDRATPRDLMRETAGLIKGACFRLIPNAGHLPCIERPDEIGRRHHVIFAGNQPCLIHIRPV